MKAFYLLILFSVVCCYPQTQDVPAWLTWSHDYTTVAGTPLDSNIIEFTIYGSQYRDSNYVVISEQPDTSFYLLFNPGFYIDKEWFFYCEASRVDILRYSEPSDTVSEFFPILVPGTPYNLKMLNFEKVE